MILIPSDLADLEYENHFDLWEIIKHLRNFYRLAKIDIDEIDEAKRNLIEARISMDNARLLLINLLQSDKNTYLSNDKLKNSWNLLMDNLARIDARLDIVENETLDSIDKYAISRERAMNAFPRLKQYQGAIFPIAENIIYQPIKIAQARFYKEEIKVKDGKDVLRDGNLFAYFIFVALFNSSQQLGNLYRTPTQSSKKAPTSTNLGASTNVVIEELPNNVQTTENPEVAQIVEEFTFPSSEGGNNELQTPTTV